MKKRSWKRLAALALAVIMALFAVACSSVPAKTDDTVENQGNQREMTVWIAKTFNDSADKQLAERIKSFAEVDDRVSKVNVETFAGSEGQSKWNAAIESGNVPDVSFLVAAPYANFSEMGLLEDLSDVIRDIEGNLGALYPAVREDMTSDSGEIYAVPISNSASMLHYRTDYFEKAGITAPPANWEEMELVCEKLKAANPDVYPFGHCISSSDDSEAQNLWILRSFGGRLWDENGNVAVNSPETIKAVNYIVGLYEKGYIPKSTIEWDSSGNNKSFLSGESAMAMNPGTLYNEIINGDMKDTLGKTTAIAPLPLGEYEAWKEPGRNMLSVFKGARDVELSKDLIRYVFEPEWYDEYMEMNYPVNVPVFSNALQDKIWQSGDGLALVQQAEHENSSFGYPSTDPAVIRADASSLQNFMFSKTLIRVITEGQSPEDAVAQLEKELNELKDEMASQNNG